MFPIFWSTGNFHRKKQPTRQTGILFWTIFLNKSGPDTTVISSQEDIFPEYKSRVLGRPPSCLDCGGSSVFYVRSKQYTGCFKACWTTEEANNKRPLIFLCTCWHNKKCQNTNHSADLYKMCILFPGTKNKK